MEYYNIEEFHENQISKGLRFLANEPGFLELTPEQRMSLALQYAHNVLSAKGLRSLCEEINFAFSVNSYEGNFRPIRDALVRMAETPSISPADLFCISRSIQELKDAMEK